MFEVASAGKDHCDPMLISSMNYLIVTDGTPGLNDGGDTAFRRFVDRVSKREKCIRRHRATFKWLVCFFHRKASGVNAAHLSSANAQGFPISRIYDGIGFNVLGHQPGKQQVIDFFGIGLSLGDHF